MQTREKSNSESSYVLAPYTMTTSNPVIIDRLNKNHLRMRSIDKIFSLGLDIKFLFSPKKSISGRYSKKVMGSNYFEKLEIKNPTK